MAGSGGFAVSRSHREDRFYNPPAMRRHQQITLQQQLPKQLQRVVKSVSVAQVHLPESVILIESDDSLKALSQPSSSCSSFPKKLPPTNLDTFLESVTPTVAVRNFSEVKGMEGRTREAESSAFYVLEDLWESFREWSAYGVGVPLLLNGEITVKQYYVPFLSGIQLYVDPLKPRQLYRRSNQDSGTDLSMETSSVGSDYLSDKRLKSLADGLSNQHNHVNTSQQLNRHLGTERSATNSSGDEAESTNSPRKLFNYMEEESPYNRKPFTDKISDLASKYPQLRTCKSSDLVSPSWISVAWYPIYRIPMGPTLRDLDASFLTFHYLSTQPRCNSVDVVTSTISLPVFGLATYKLKGSILTHCGPRESEKENSLLQAADNFLQQLQVVHNDYQFFRDHAH